MNVVFVSAQPFPYGMAGSKRIRLFANRLSQNHQVKVLVTGSDNGRNSSKGVEKNVKYEFIRFSRLSSIAGRSKVKAIVNRHFNPATKNVMFIYDGIGLTNILFATYGRKAGFKIVTDVVEDYGLHEENAGFLLSTLHKLNAGIEKRTADYADGVVTLSTTLKNKFVRLGVKETDVELIPVSAENIDQPVVAAKPNGSFTFVYSGSYGNKDGVDVLVEAFKRLKEKKPQAALVLAGKISDKIKTMIAGVNGISYAGMIPDAGYYDFLGTADCLLMTRVGSPYANAGFPFKLGEYLATGRPVIATKVSDVELYLKDREDVIMAAPSDAGSLLSAMEYALDNRDRLDTIGKNGKQKCRRFFDPVTNGDQLEKFLVKITERA